MRPRRRLWISSVLQDASCAILAEANAVRQQLAEREWGPHLHVTVEGFTPAMSDYMAAADVIVTKAGPGTIAEACIRGLPRCQV